MVANGPPSSLLVIVVVVVVMVVVVHGKDGDELRFEMIMMMSCDSEFEMNLEQLHLLPTTADNPCTQHKQDDNNDEFYLPQQGGFEISLFFGDYDAKKSPMT
jgi:hypothetical protein